MHYILGLLGLIVGGAITLQSEWFLQNFGRVDWAEIHLGTEGGSRLFYKLIGIGIALISLLYMTGILQNMFLSVLGRFFVSL